ncbi:uncharacterized protein Bfra_004951 [Botrytis fragariae]|uniref:CCHC-type domain-containing protein n=1 Tax=Botrytis fragariae TaxID=1964551 RepID=A0A8H6AU18_9HELO|nr:uncharacterized protein Bfra_004951 [Botrytis fragariae]KAF5873490.1 hypothetical protein Bfra_004951 [Botrytis fragariae]
MSDHFYMEGLEAMGHKAHSDGIGYSAIYSWYGQTMDRLQSDSSNISVEFRSLTAKVETWKHFWPDEPFFAGISLKSTSRKSFEPKDQNKPIKPVKNSTSSSSKQHSSQKTLTTLSPTAGSSKQPIIPDASRSLIKSQQGSHGNRKRDYKRYLNVTCANCNMRGHNLSYCVAPVDEFGFISGCPRCNTKEHLFDDCPSPITSKGKRDWVYLVRRRTNCPPIRCSKDIRHLQGFENRTEHPWTYDFSLKQVGKFEILYDEYGEPKGLYPDPAWKTPDRVLSQAYPRMMDIALPRLWRFHLRLYLKSADLGHKFEEFLKSMSETASDNRMITCEIVRLAEALEDISELESNEARGERLPVQRRIDITTKEAKEMEFEAKLNAYHVPENSRLANNDSSPDNEMAVSSTEGKGKGKAIDVRSTSFSYRYGEEEQNMYRNYEQRYTPDNPFSEGASSNIPSESTRPFENLVARKEFRSNLTPPVENYKRRDSSSPEKVPDCVPVDTDTQSSGPSEEGENQLSKFAEFKYEQSREQKQLEKKISNLKRDLKEINSFEKRMEMLTTDQCNQVKMKEFKERELRVLLEIRSRYVTYPEQTAGSKTNMTGRRHHFGAPAKQAPNLEYPDDRHGSNGGGSSKSRGKSSTSKEFSPEGFQIKNLKYKNIGRNPAMSTSSVPKHLQKFPFASIRKSPLSYVQTAPIVGDQDPNGNNDSTSPEKSQSPVVIKQDLSPAFNRRQKAKDILNGKLNRSSRNARTISSAAKAMSIIPRPQSSRLLKSVTESQGTFPAMNETQSESVADRHSKLLSSHTQVATSSSENFKKETIISESTNSYHLQPSDEIKNQTGLISGPMDSGKLPTAVDDSQNLSSASNEKQAVHVANTNLELASRDVQSISNVDEIYQHTTKLKTNNLQQSPLLYVPSLKAKQMLASKDETPSTSPQPDSKAFSSVYKPLQKREKQSTPGNEHQSLLLQEDRVNHGKSPATVHIPPQMRITQPSKDESPPPMTQSSIQMIEPGQSSPRNSSVSQNPQLLDPEVAYPKKSNKKSSSIPPDQSYLEEEEDSSSSIPQYRTSPRPSNLQQKFPRTMRRSVRQHTLSSDSYLPEPENPFFTPRLKETVSKPSNSWPELLDPDSFADFLDCESPNDKIDLSVPLPNPDTFSLDNEDCNIKKPLRSSISLPDPDIFLLDEEDRNPKESLRSSIPTMLHSRPHRQSNYASSTISGGNSKIQEADRAVSDENASKICFECNKVGHYLIDCPSSWRLDALVLDNFPHSSSRYRAGLGNYMQAKANKSDFNPSANNYIPTWSRNSYPVHASLPSNVPHPNLPHIANAGNRLQAKPKSDLDPPTGLFYPNRLTKGDHLVEGLPENWIEIAERIDTFFHENWEQEVKERIETRFWEVQKIMSKTGYNFSLANYSDDEGSGDEESEDEEITVRLPWQTKSSDCSPWRETRERKKRPPISTRATAIQTGHDYNIEEKVRNMLTRGPPNGTHGFQPRRIMNGTGFFYPIPGDWFCISAGCRERNDSEHVICKKCSSSRGTRRVDGRIEIFQPGDWVCPFRYCSRHNYAKHVVCKDCGSRSKAPTTAPVLWKCSSFNCGEINDDGVVRCRKCGSPRIIFHNPPPRATVNAFHAGDWYCGTSGCAAHNSSRDISCWKCGGTDTTLLVPGQVVQNTTGFLPPPGWNCNMFGCGVYNQSNCFNCWQCGNPRADFFRGPSIF